MPYFEFSDAHEPHPDLPHMSLSISGPTASSLFLEMRWQGKQLSSGSGFVVEHRGASYLITNKHNLAGADPRTGNLMSSRGVSPDVVAILHHRSFDPARFQVVSEPLLDDANNPLWLEHPHDPAVDVVALPLTQLDDVTLHPYVLAPPERPMHVEVGDGVSIIGFPYAKAHHPEFPLPTWSHGYIATEPMFNEDQILRYLVDVRSRSGQSGSPVVLYRPPGWVNFERAGQGPLMEFSKQPLTQLLGIYSGRLLEEEHNPDPSDVSPGALEALERRILRRVQSSDFGIVWKVNVIRDVVEHGVVRNPASTWPTA